MLRPGELVIGEHNYKQFLSDQVVDGETRARGLVPRDFGKYPIGTVEYRKVVAHHAVDFPTIPRGEWSERVRDKVAQKSQLSDIRLTGNSGQMIPSLDQNGRGYSHSADTEVLTEKGWCHWSNYNWSDLLATVNLNTQLMEFQAPTEGHAYEYDDEMYYSTNRRLDFGVTRNHRMIVRKWDERQRTLSKFYTEQRADQLGWYVGMMHAPSGFIGTELKRLGIEGDREYDGDDFLALTSLICSDGYAGSSENTNGLVSFCCFREEMHDSLSGLAARCGFREQPNRKGVWNRNGAHALAAWVKANCYTGGPYRSPNKKVPELVKWATTRQIKHFLDYFGDQNHGEKSQTVFYSSSKRMMDDLQELHLRIGKRGTITSRDPRSTVYKKTGQVISGGPSYSMIVGDVDRLCIDRNKHIETDHYKGTVFCATVPNGTLVTRRNGSVLISGNCWAHSSTSCTIILRAVMNAPYVGLSAYAIACIIKQYQDEGGWGAQSLDFITERGVPSYAFWPAQSMSRSNDNPQTWANAALHKVTEGWVDLQAAQYDRNLTWDQHATCWLCDVPTVVDLNWWSHSICGLDLVDGSAQRGETRAESGKLVTLEEFDRIWGMNNPVTGGFGSRIWNSWGDSWSDRGMGILTSDKSVPDGGAAPRVTYPSPV